MITRLAICITLVASPAFANSSQDTEFFEKNIRPVLAENCYICHNSLGTKKGGLALDYKAALDAGGDSGKVVVPGKPGESVLLWALKHENGYEMPAKAPQLSQAVIGNFEQWIKNGAHDPRLKKPSKDDLTRQRPWEQIREERRAWWSFQPLKDHPVPTVIQQDWSDSVIDRFLFHRMQAEGLNPQPIAQPEVLVRRLHLLLTGLPPKPEQVKAFAANPTDDAYAAMVDELLASDAFGKRWARHWMDWYRYAESHGSEGDPRIPYASEYRDYLIRALNADVSYDQLLKEHLAGDLLKNPRIDPQSGRNESAIGPAHLRMVPHGFGVTDAYGEQITFTDNQIDVISKAMLGVTVSCARCHDHKFDPISQKDFYRLFGVLIGSRPSTVVVDSPEKLHAHKTELTEQKKRIRRQLSDAWLKQIDHLPQWLEQNGKAIKTQTEITHPLAAWNAISALNTTEYAAAIARQRKSLADIATENQKRVANAAFYLDLRKPENTHAWTVIGNGTADQVSPAGSFAVWPTGNSAIRGIYPRGIYTHLLSSKHAGVFTSQNVRVAGNATFVRTLGEKAQLRAPVRNYPLIQGLHPADVVNAEDLTWKPTQRKWQYWQGELVHYELATDRDKLPRPGNAERSWFGIIEIFAGDQPPKPEGASLFALIEKPDPIGDRDELLEAYQHTLRRILTAWRDGEITDQESVFLNTFLRAGFFANTLKELPESLQASMESYRQLEAKIPVPRRAPGVIDSENVRQPLLIRGDHRNEAEPIAHQFLEVFSDQEFSEDTPPRLALANAIVSDANTLKTRVLVNRVWGYVFGRGIASSTDNLGRMGQQPTHPELLDMLCLEFERNGWSLKRLIKQLVLSRAFRSTSQARIATRQRDPGNAFLSHFSARRLDAESIHDSLNALAGTNARAIDQPVIRNRLDPFLQAFNAPVPTSTVSTRTQTNVPAQTLAMMNGPLVQQSAEKWSARILRDDSLATPEDKITAMIREAYARDPHPQELEILNAFRQTDPEDLKRRDQLITKENELQKQQKTLADQRAALLKPIRERLEKQLSDQNPDQQKLAQKSLRPISHWQFDGNARDSIGKLHGELVGDAKIADGQLVLSGGFVKTTPITQPLKEKTLEVLLRLDRLDQRGGGAMTVQTTDGNLFDSIVFAEAKPATWLAGSNFFQRTIPLDGRPENEPQQPVHLVLIYAADGTIRCYRNGILYGKPYRKSAAVTFPQDKSQVIFGLRHGTKPTGGRMLFGHIDEARLYDRALDENEVTIAAQSLGQGRVTRNMILAELNADEKTRLKSLEEKLTRISNELQTVSEQRKQSENALRLRNGGYFGIAHALLNSQEFLYVP